jgi:hypothetical protein
MDDPARFDYRGAFARTMYDSCTSGTRGLVLSLAAYERDQARLELYRCSTKPRRT